MPAAPPHTRMHDRLPLVLIVLALVVTVAAITTVLLLARHQAAVQQAPDTGPLVVAAAPAPGADTNACRTLVSALPDDLSGLARRQLTQAQPGVAAWGDPPLILRCGLADPAELTCSSALVQFSNADGPLVAWLRLTDSANSAAVTYIAVDRPVRVAVTLPPGAGVGPIQQLSEIIAAHLPIRPVCQNGALVPAQNG